jgi:hypothetical protein
MKEAPCSVKVKTEKKPKFHNLIKLAERERGFLFGCLKSPEADWTVFALRKSEGVEEN